MKIPTKIIWMALAAFFASSALAASAQAADQWYIGPTQTGTFTTIPVGTNVPINGTSGVTQLAKPKLGFTTECKKDVFTGSIQNATTPVEAHITISLHLTECGIKGVSTAVCQVRSKGAVNGTVAFSNLTGKSNTSTGVNKAHVLFAPASGTVITEIEVLGEECAFAQSGAVKTEGAVEGALSPEGNVAAQKVLVTFPTTALAGSTLKYGSNPATLVSTETAELTSKEWVVLK